MSNRAGLSGILSGRADKGVIQQVPGVTSLFILPVGTTPPNPLELVERPAFGLLMRELASKFDYVVVDTPATVYGADAAVIAARCGTALVIARKDASRVGMLQELVGSFSGSPAKLAGVVMKLGAYGCLRVAMTLFPEGLEAWKTWIAVLAVIGIVHGALVAVYQRLAFGLQLAAQGALVA